MPRYMRAPVDEWTLRNLTVLGIVANPKTNEPALLVTNGDYVSLRSLSHDDPLFRIGRGYFDDNDTPPTSITGFPRCHTPDGVQIKGQGWGTSLYSGLAVAAALNDSGHVTISGYGSGEGCSSWTKDRTDAADKWWTSALKIGLARQETGKGGTETEENVELDLSPRDLEDYVDDGTIVYVNKVSVDVERTAEIEVEALPYANIADAHLIAAEMAVLISNELIDELAQGSGATGSLEALCRAVEEDAGRILRVDPVALQAFDVRGIGQGGMELIAACFFYAELGEQAIRDLWRRNEQGLDPGVAGRGRRVSAVGGGMRDVLDARHQSGWAALASLPD